MPIPRPGALPAYLRIAEQLTRDIRAGVYVPGQRLAPEREMAKDFGVTVTTLRKALKIMVDRGLIQRRHGSGNYVLDGRHDLGTYALFRLELLSGGGLPTARILSLTRCATDQSLPVASALGPQAWNIRRIRYLNELPVAIEDIWLSGRFNGALTPETASDSLYHSYRAVFGLTISRVEDRVGVGILPAWAEAATGFATQDHLGHPHFGLVRRCAFDEYDALAEVSTTWFDPRRAAYVSRTP